MKLFERGKKIYGQYGYACVNACFCKSFDERGERDREIDTEREREREERKKRI